MQSSLVKAVGQDERPRRITEALVAVGGSGARLRADGFPLSLSKAFIELDGKPLLYWCLRSLHQSGIRRIVLTADTNDKLTRAGQVVRGLPVQFGAVHLVRNSAPGSTGLPYHARSLFDRPFIFECGHAVVPSWHYQRMMDHWWLSPGNVIAILTAYPPVTTSFRHEIELDGTVVAVAEPLIASSAYCAVLPRLGFDPGCVFKRLVANRAAGLVRLNYPIEPDVRAELEPALSRYRQTVSDAEAGDLAGA